MAPHLLDELDGNRFHMGLIGSGAKKGPRPFVTTCPPSCSCVYNLEENTETFD